MYPTFSGVCERIPKPCPTAGAYWLEYCRNFEWTRVTVDGLLGGSFRACGDMCGGGKEGKEDTHGLHMAGLVESVMH